MNPNRRRLMGLFAMAAPAVALGSVTQAATSTKADRFLLAMETIHPKGRVAAERALAAGQQPEWLFGVTMPDRAGGRIALLFEDGAGALRTFYSDGEA